MSYIDGILWWRDAKVVEPQKRNKDGMRWIIHRFPIKGGISMRDAQAHDMCEASIDWVSRLKINWPEDFKVQHEHD